MSDTINFMEKIKKNDPNTYIIFYRKNCPYSMKALQLLRNYNFSYKGYDVTSIPNGMSRLLTVLNKNISSLRFNPNHRTVPMIFYNGIFIGGYDDLVRSLSHTIN